MKISTLMLFLVMIYGHTQATINVKLHAEAGKLEFAYWDAQWNYKYLILMKGDSDTVSFDAADFTLVEFWEMGPRFGRHYFDARDGDSIVFTSGIKDYNFELLNVGEIYALRKKTFLQSERLIHQLIRGKNDDALIKANPNYRNERAAVLVSSLLKQANMDTSYLQALASFRERAGYVVTNIEGRKLVSYKEASGLFREVLNYANAYYLGDNPILANVINRIQDGLLRKFPSEYRSKETYSLLKASIRKSLFRDVLLERCVKHWSATDVERLLEPDSLAFANWSRVYAHLKTAREKREAASKTLVDVGHTRVLNQDSTAMPLDSLLSTIRTKLILIDLWASWCAPCIENFAYQKKLETKYKGKLTFFYISTDKQYQAWKKADKKYIYSAPDVYSFNLLGPRNTIKLFDNSIVFDGIPRYIIVSPQGKVLNKAAPYPYDPKLVTELNALLKKQ
jgi:thiol-disulfide isomerase/thioredoxin